jgi:hypothetical protein
MRTSTAHAATIGGAGPEPIPRADVDRRGLSFTAVREHTFTNLTDQAVRDGTRPPIQRRRMTYRYQAPLTATPPSATKWDQAAGGSAIMAVPISRKPILA